MTDDGDRLQELMDEMQASRGAEVHRELRSLRTSVGIVTHNFAEVDVLDRTHAAKGFELHGDDNQDEMDRFHLEFAWAFHNFVASVYSLITHSQRFVNTYGSEAFRRRYSEQLVDRGLDEKAEFLKHLRHYTQKRKVPPISMRVHASREDLTQDEFETEFNIVVRKDRLLEWDGWSSAGRRHLESLDDPVDVPAEIRAYHETMAGFYDWFFAAAHEEFQDAYAEHDALLAEFERLREER